MAFLSKSLGAVPEDPLLGSIRVAVVGDAFVGKTALTELIANGHPSKSYRSTAGCHIHVKLVDTPQTQPSDPVSRRFFVELWDVSGQPKYQQLRSVFYKQINGVILVYDLTNRKTLSRLPKWAAEIARGGSFVAPLAEELALRNIGGLPVPVLVVGNKADRLRYGSTEALSSMINNACSQIISRSACSSWWQRSIAGLRGRRLQTAESTSSSITPELSMEQHVKGVTASAAAGQLDWDVINGFLASLWERRYKPLSSSTQTAYMHRNSSFAGGSAAVSAGIGIGGMIGSSSSKADHDQRLDDDWV